MLLQTNPILHEDSCDEELKEGLGLAYCISPLRSWNTEVSFPYNYLGCYVQPNKKQIVLWAFYTGSPEMDPRLCAEARMIPGYPFFGLVEGRGVLLRRWADGWLGQSRRGEL